MSYSEITYRPLTLWTWPETDLRRPSPFRASFSDSLAALRFEVVKLGGKNAILQIDVAPEQFRRDGQVYVNAAWRSPRVVLSLDSKYGPLSYPCDRFTHWHDNVRAIALGLEALRKVDRYGITRRGEQYTGWKALPASTAPTMGVEAAGYTLAANSDVAYEQIVGHPAQAKAALRAARAATHPDRNSGNRDDWDDVETARSVLSSHHGVSL